MKKTKRDTYAKNTIKAIVKRIIPRSKKKIIEEQFVAKYNRADQAPFHIALVLDGMVEDIINYDKRLGILMLSDPEIIEIRDLNSVGIDWRYNPKTKKFYEES